MKFDDKSKEFVSAIADAFTTAGWQGRTAASSDNNLPKTNSCAEQPMQSLYLLLSAR
jgi:hypothetical protein